MKKYRLVFVLSILFLGVIKLTASEYEQVRKAPRVHVRYGSHLHCRKSN